MHRRMEPMGLVLGALLVVVITILGRILLQQIWRPYVITRYFKKQGVTGPSYRLWSGSIEEIKSFEKGVHDLILENNCHDITKRVLVHYREWIPRYGETFLFWVRSEPTICVSDVESVKQIMSNKFGFFPKIKVPDSVWGLLGKGLLLVEGEEWVRHRKVVNPAFAIDKLKLLTKTMAECTKTMIDGWLDETNRERDGRKEIEVSAHLQELTADVISHTAFGSSYQEGKEVFLAQKKLQILVAESLLNLNFPGSKYLPTKINRQKWKVERIIRNTLTSIINCRLDSKDASGFGNDLLGLILEASQVQHGESLSMDEIVDECKTFFFAGQETTSHLLAWAMFLLSTNRDWQERLREEVIEYCGNELPNHEMLSKLKLVTMVLNETLRLYGPIIMLARRTEKDMSLGNLNIPKDTMLLIPIPIIHRDMNLWGADANEFNPLRFENGVSKAATHPNALLSFSIGPRACIGQNFAMMEAKIVLALILQHFSFTLSPNYKHAPVDVITLQPKFGLPIILKPLLV